METKEKVLQIMKEAGEPLNAGKIAEIGGIDRLFNILQTGRIIRLDDKCTAFLNRNTGNLLQFISDHTCICC